MKSAENYFHGGVKPKNPEGLTVSRGSGPYSGIAETTTRMTKFQLARLVFETLKKNGMLKKGATFKMIQMWMISKCITDRDGDGYPEIDVNELVKRGIVKLPAGQENIDMLVKFKGERFRIACGPEGSAKKKLAAGHKNESSSEVIGVGAKLQGHPLITQYFPDNEEWSTEVKKRDPSSPEAAAEIKRKLGENPTLGEACNFLQGKYNVGTIDQFNQWVGDYFSVYHVHLWITLSEHSEDYYLAVDIDYSTRPSDFSQATRGKGKHYARYLCNTYAQAGYLMLSRIKDKSGNPAFDVWIVSMSGGDTGHDIVIFKDKKTGRVFVFSNGKVIKELKRGRPGAFDDDDIAMVKGFLLNRSSHETFHLYTSLENYRKDKVHSSLTRPHSSAE